MRRKSDAFAARVEEYRRFFAAAAPFGVPAPRSAPAAAGAAADSSADGSGAAPSGAGATTTARAELRLEHVAPAYAAIDAFRAGGVGGRPSVPEIVAEAKALQEVQDLFELYVQDHLPLTRCAEDLQHLKGVWDMAAAVLHTFADWWAPSGWLAGAILGCWAQRASGRGTKRRG